MALGQYITGMAFPNVALAIPAKLEAMKEESLKFLPQSTADACVQQSKEAAVEDFKVLLRNTKRSSPLFLFHSAVGIPNLIGMPIATL